MKSIKVLFLAAMIAMCGTAAADEAKDVSPVVTMIVSKSKLAQINDADLKEIFRAVSDIAVALPSKENADAYASVFREVMDRAQQFARTHSVP
ncbi:conjugal transfer protein TraF [Herbaspirillum huttiense]|uniref:conjugal transfer protein TraF n=1 Tax=Herbaspirillum huttiense TaxID=863372 RepID=UPI0039B0481E